MSTYLVKHVSPSGQTHYRSVYYRAPTVLRREGKNLVLSFEYNAQLVAHIAKDIPWYGARYRWDSQDWLINPVYGETAIRLVKEVLGEEIMIQEEER